MKKIKLAYQQVRLPAGELSSYRIELGRREIATFKNLLGLTGRQIPGDGGVFLDVGCGDRHLEPAISDLRCRYIGLDIDTTNFETDAFPLEDLSVDAAISLAVLEHLHDPELFLSEIYRCLKPGGAIYLSTPNFQYDWRNFYNDPTHVRPYTPISLKKLLSLSGYKDVEVFPGPRCKPLWYYKGDLKFWKAFYLLPFRSDTKWVPPFLKGHARSIFAIGFKK
ncbi:class I SAM-dependent methyltransferase [Castellaniella sp.]|uniref:class I SAM-dependent methyltransferase n=1 Tax=Castellaniella sp. TaxID=1955812 RepID=UPI002AFEDFF7|nr:class I SAM-dependent methyltransferase [Castellaniella sp.]